MKKLFTAIRQGDMDTVCALLDKKPELITCTAKAPPKKDAGQSPLQVAIKSGNPAIAHLLLDRGADVNFMEAEDCGNEWRMPVVQDAVMAAVRSTRWNTVLQGQVIHNNSAEKAETAFQLLKRMVDMGADLTRADSYGNSALVRALLDTRQIIPGFHHGEQRYIQDRLLTPELEADLNRIFSLIMTASPEVTQHVSAPDSKETLLMQFLLNNGGLRYEEHRYDAANRRWVSMKE